LLTYYDYSSTQGTIIMSLEIYRQHWRDPAITSIALYLKPGVDVDQRRGDPGLRNRPSSPQIRPNLALRGYSTCSTALCYYRRALLTTLVALSVS
jgi:hypothetical protein